MIGKLRGYVEQVRPDHLLLDVQGVGYRVFASATTLEKLRGEGEQVALFIETHVREDHIHLYGFLSEAEQDMFTLLTTVQGVGNKMALAVLSTFSAVDIANIILVQDVTALTRVSGIGKRIAERMVTELKNKLLSLELGGSATVMAGASRATAPAPTTAASAEASVLADAISALEHLGYSRVDAHRAAYASMQEGTATLDAAITQALRKLAK
jgi:holliday junction DNA helicase RuvA